MNKNQHNTRIQKAVQCLASLQEDGKLSHCTCDGEPNPSRDELKEIIELCRSVLFPGFFGDNAAINPATLPYHLGVNMERLFSKLSSQLYAGMCFGDDNRQMSERKALAKDMASEFIEKLPEIKEILTTDVEAIFNGDPAAKNFGEIILSYPGIRAIVNYRIAHCLLQIGANILIPRIITEMAHSETGIDIHPGATIGKYFAIDHGTGIVIGETCIIGNNVKLYQGVTLGAKSFPTDADNNPIKGIPRHPILEDNVVVYAGATILGRITIGKNSVIGGNTWVTTDVAAGSVITI
ncbi:MAG: serine acetyltransferase [Paludibacteraceae bacterium]|nr:serine acetyltransferase [Paludibacteraceae bacterium]